MNLIVSESYNADAVRLYSQAPKPARMLFQHVTEDHYYWINSTSIRDHWTTAYGTLGDWNLTTTEAQHQTTVDRLAVQYGANKVSRKGIKFFFYDQQGRNFVNGECYDTRHDQVRVLSVFGADNHQQELRSFWQNGQEISRFVFDTNNWVRTKIYVDVHGKDLIREWFDSEAHDGDHPVMIEVLDGQMAGRYASNEAFLSAYVRVMAPEIVTIYPLRLSLADDRTIDSQSVQEMVADYRHHQLPKQNYRPDLDQPDGVALKQWLLNFNQEVDEDRRRTMLQETLGQTGSRVHFEGNIAFDYPKNIFLGDWFWANRNILFNSDGKITIGFRCLLGPNVSFFTAGHTVSADIRSFGVTTADPITIGNNVWIGGNVTILGETTIGDRCVVGAGSVVHGDFPADSLIIGNPVRVVKKLNQE